MVSCISELIRADTDWLARYGGEEFLIVLPETQLKNASGLAERLRKKIANKSIEIPGDTISITASFGVTGFDASNSATSITSQALIRTADRRLYEAKNQGRNKVVSGSFKG
jgi:diguanylate cyclase (GGDEF)-like protein